jgi:hypothetical protein
VLGPVTVTLDVESGASDARRAAEVHERRVRRVEPALGSFFGGAGEPDEAAGARREFEIGQDHPAGPDLGDPRPGNRGNRAGPVRRRAFLLAAGLAGTVVAAPDGWAADGMAVDPAAFLARRLEGVLLDNTATTAQPVPAATLQTVLTTARTDFRACRYVELAARLPELITAAEAAHGHAADPVSASVVAQAYNLASRALIKLEASGLEWVSADRAVRAAEDADDPLILAEAQRLLGSACRRAGIHDRAQELTLSAAGQLDLAAKAPDPRHLALHGVLMCSAGYAAARAGDHDRATDLLTEAEATAERLADHPAQQRDAGRQRGQPPSVGRLRARQRRRRVAPRAGRAAGPVP